jgi:hypothetical protein
MQSECVVSTVFIGLALEVQAQAGTVLNTLPVLRP